MTMAPDGIDRDAAERHRERRAGPAGAGRRCRRRRSRRRRWPPPAKGTRGCRPRRSKGPVDYRETRAARGNQAAVDRHAHVEAAHRPHEAGAGRSPAGGVPRQRQVRGRDEIDRRGAGRDLSGRPGSPRPLAVDERPGPPPTVTNGQLTVHARTISMTMRTQKLKADTDVRSMMDRKPDAGPRARRGQATAGREGADASCPSHAETGSAGDDPIEPARVRRRSVARYLTGGPRD